MVGGGVAVAGIISSKFRRNPPTYKRRLCAAFSKKELSEAAEVLRAKWQKGEWYVEWAGPKNLAITVAP